MANTPAVTLRLAPGSGRIVRRTAALLFVPETSDDELIKIFSEATSDREAVDDVCKHAVAANFSVSAFAMIAWEEPTKIFAFGDLAVATDQASAPMISGAGSATWVEHSLRGVGGDATVSTAADEVDSITRLDSGVANAGGFSLTVHASTEAPAVSAAPEPEPAPVPSISPVPAAVTPPPSPFGSAEADEPAAAPDADVAAAVVPVLPLAGPTPTPPRPASIAPVSELSNGSVAADANGAATAPPIAPPQAPPQLVADAPPRPAAVVGADAPLAAASGPTFAEEQPSAPIPLPVFPRLELDSGDHIELSAPVLIGRRPDPSPYEHVSGLRGHKLKGEKLSRSHVIVRSTPTGIAVSDCESLNGTIVVVAPGATPKRIEAGREITLAAGATIHFGDETATVVDPR